MQTCTDRKPHDDIGKDNIYMPRRDASEGTNPAITLILDFRLQTMKKQISVV